MSGSMTFCQPLGQADLWSDAPPSRGIKWPRAVLTWVWLTWAQTSLFFRCNLPMPSDCLMPLSAPLIPHHHPQYRHQVVKSGTTAGQHDISSACGSSWCFVRCTPPHHPYASLMPQVEASGGHEWYYLGSHWPELMFYGLQCSIDHLEFSRVLCNRLSWFFRCHPLMPPCCLSAPLISLPHPTPSTGI